MNLISYLDSGFEKALERLSEASSLFDPIIEQRTRDIIEAVRLRGDEALIELTERFDGAKLEAEDIAVSKAELVSAGLMMSDRVREVVAEARENIERFSRRSLRKNWQSHNSHGGQVGEKFDPYTRVGIYVPGGTAPLVSTALMTVTLARVAGCREVDVCTPCGKESQIDPSLLYALQTAGATSIHRLGGAQAIAAMAFGTPTIPKAQKIFGPGNAYVVAAKRLLFGHVAVDLLPGPSEVLVLADDTADPRYVAADMLAQAEHGSGHERVWLVTPSKALIKSVKSEISRQISRLSRREFIERALKQNGWMIHVTNVEQGIAVANRLAPEHCELMVRHPAKAVSEIVTAGGIFVGQYSPTVLGDYVAGPSHVLPTGGAGASFPGLTVDQFQRRTSVVEYDQKSLRRALGAVQELARMEGLDAHAQSAAIRVETKTSKRLQK